MHLFLAPFLFFNRRFTCFRGLITVNHYQFQKCISFSLVHSQLAPVCTDLCASNLSLFDMCRGRNLKETSCTFYLIKVQIALSAIGSNISVFGPVSDVCARRERSPPLCEGEATIKVARSFARLARCQRFRSSCGDSATGRDARAAAPRRRVQLPRAAGLSLQKIITLINVKSAIVGQKKLYVNKNEKDVKRFVLAVCRRRKLISLNTTGLWSPLRSGFRP